MLYYIQAQQVAVKSFSVFYTACSQACVFSVCGVFECGCCGWQPVVLILQVLQVLGEKRGLFFARIIWSRGTACSGEEKADWLHILSVFVSVGPLFSLFLPLRE